MLYKKKLSMRELYEWGNKVWIHTLGGSKLDGCLRIGRWIDYDEVSNGYTVVGNQSPPIILAILDLHFLLLELMHTS